MYIVGYRERAVTNGECEYNPIVINLKEVEMLEKNEQLTTVSLNDNNQLYIKETHIVSTLNKALEIYQKL